MEIWGKITEQKGLPPTKNSQLPYFFSSNLLIDVYTKKN